MKPRRYRELAGADGYRPDDSYVTFLGRHGLGARDPRPNRTSCRTTCCIVGGPGQIPFRFQYELDVMYAVGRLAFDTVEEYARYARRVVAAETVATGPAAGCRSSARATRTIAATAMSADHLVGPLAEQLAAAAPRRLDGRPRTSGRARPPRRGLLELLAGAEPPSLLFTASHGMVFPNGDPAPARAPGRPAVPGLAGPRGLARPPSRRTSTWPATTCPTPTGPAR